MLFTGLIRLQAILKRHGPDHHPITLRQLDPGGDNRQIFKSVKNSGETHIIIDCKPENVLQYLRQANEVKLMGDYQVSLFCLVCITFILLKCYV